MKNSFSAAHFQKAASLKKNALQPYVHSRYEPVRRFLRFLIRHIGFNFLARMGTVEGLENIPEKGAAVLVINHVAFIDPIVAIHAAPRSIVPMAKVEVYSYPVVGIFPRLWNVIPVRREEIDRQAVRQALQVLEAGELVLVAPEGTRHDSLRDARVGAAYLASRSSAPIIPVAITHTRGFPTHPFSKRFRGPGASVKFGKPFHFKPEYSLARGQELRKMTDEVMYILAAMLPEHLRGEYSDLSKATRETIQE